MAGRAVGLLTMNEEELRTECMAEEPETLNCRLRYALDPSLPADQSRTVPEDESDRGLIEVRCGRELFEKFKKAAEGVDLGIPIEFEGAET